MIVVASEGLVRVDDRKSRGAGGDCESDSNKCDDFFHGRILSKRAIEPYHSQPTICDRNYRKLRLALCEKETAFAPRNYHFRFSGKSGRRAHVMSADDPKRAPTTRVRYLALCGQPRDYQIPRLSAQA